VKEKFSGRKEGGEVKPPSERKRKKRGKNFFYVTARPLAGGQVLQYLEKSRGKEKRRGESSERKKEKENPSSSLRRAPLGGRGGGAKKGKENGRKEERDSAGAEWSTRKTGPPPPQPLAMASVKGQDDFGREKKKGKASRHSTAERMREKERTAGISSSVSHLGSKGSPMVKTKKKSTSPDFTRERKRTLRFSLPGFEMIVQEDLEGR